MALLPCHGAAARRVELDPPRAAETLSLVTTPTFPAEAAPWLSTASAQALRVWELRHQWCLRDLVPTPVFLLPSHEFSQLPNRSLPF